MQTAQTIALCNRIGKQLAEDGLPYPYVAAAVIACRGVLNMTQPASAAHLGIDAGAVKALEQGEVRYLDVPQVVADRWTANGLDPKDNRATFDSIEELTEHWETLGCPSCGALEGLQRFDCHAHKTDFDVTDDERVDRSDGSVDDSFRGDEALACPHCGLRDLIANLSFFYVLAPPTDNPQHDMSGVVVAEAHREAIDIWCHHQQIQSTFDDLAASGLQVSRIGNAPANADKGPVAWNLNVVLGDKTVGSTQP